MHSNRPDASTSQSGEGAASREGGRRIRNWSSHRARGIGNTSQSHIPGALEEKSGHETRIEQGIEESDALTHVHIADSIVHFCEPVLFLVARDVDSADQPRLAVGQLHFGIVLSRD